jgi:hypothetical protein
MPLSGHFNCPNASAKCDTNGKRRGNPAGKRHHWMRHSMLPIAEVSHYGRFISIL